MQRKRQADRDGATEALAAAYQGSALRASNDERLRDDSAAALGLPPAMLAELGAASGTATPFAHGVWVLLKARREHPCGRARQMVCYCARAAFTTRASCCAGASRHVQACFNAGSGKPC